MAQPAQPNPRTIPIDLAAIEREAAAIVERTVLELRRRGQPSERMGDFPPGHYLWQDWAQHVVPLTTVDGRQIDEILIRVVPTTSARPEVFVSGAFGHRGETPAVMLFINGSTTNAQLLKYAPFAGSYVRDLLVHELTHAKDKYPTSKKSTPEGKRLRSTGEMTPEQIRKHFNEHEEVRAYAQEVAQQTKRWGKALAQGGVEPRDILDRIVKHSTALEHVWNELEAKNRHYMLRVVERTLRDEGIVAEGQGAIPNPSAKVPPSLAVVENAAREIGIDFTRQQYSIEDLQEGMRVEAEHADVSTDPVVHARIAKAHLDEFADYYDRLKKMEGRAERGEPEPNPAKQTRPASSDEVQSHIDATNPHKGPRDAWQGIGREWQDLSWTLETVSLSDLPEVHPASKRDAARYAAHAKKTRGAFPAIVVVKTRNGFRILDGAHRVAAARMLGQSTILAYVGTIAEKNPRDLLEDANARTRHEKHLAARGHENLAWVVNVYSLCTDDCEGKFHVPDFKTCDRCGAQIHKRIIEVEHPEQGFMTVGSECIQDVMGWKWSTSHEQAWQNQEVIEAYLEKIHMPFAIIQKGKGGALLNRTFDDSFFQYDAHRPSMERQHAFSNMRNQFAFVAKWIHTEHGWSDRITRAGQDMGLPWEPLAQGLWLVWHRKAKQDGYHWIAFPKYGEGNITGGDAETARDAGKALEQNIRDVWFPEYEGVVEPHEILGVVYRIQLEHGEKFSKVKVIVDPDWSNAWNTKLKGTREPQPNPTSIKWSDYVRGEYWIDEHGQNEFADQDTGDAGHEMLAVNAMLDRDTLLEGLIEHARAEEDDREVEDLESLHDEADSAELFFNHSVPDEVGIAASKSKEAWEDLKKDARLAYSKHYGAILVVNREFYAYSVTEKTIGAIQSFLSELTEYEDVSDTDTEMCVEQHTPHKYACIPIAEFMLIKKPRELWSHETPSKNPVGPVSESEIRQIFADERALFAGKHPEAKDVSLSIVDKHHLVPKKDLTDRDLAWFDAKRRKIYLLKRVSGRSRSTIRGLIRHELGHAVDPNLEKEGAERRADKLAEKATGTPVRYTDDGVQNVGHGKPNRPRELHQNPPLPTTVTRLYHGARGKAGEAILASGYVEPGHTDPTKYQNKRRSALFPVSGAVYVTTKPGYALAYAARGKDSESDKGYLFELDSSGADDNTFIDEDQLGEIAVSGKVPWLTELAKRVGSKVMWSARARESVWGAASQGYYAPQAKLGKLLIKSGALSGIDGRNLMEVASQFGVRSPMRVTRAWSVDPSGLLEEDSVYSNSLDQPGLVEVPVRAQENPDGAATVGAVLLASPLEEMAIGAAVGGAAAASSKAKKNPRPIPLPREQLVKIANSLGRQAHDAIKKAGRAFADEVLGNETLTIEDVEGEERTIDVWLMTRQSRGWLDGVTGSFSKKDGRIMVKLPVDPARDSEILRSATAAKDWGELTLLGTLLHEFTHVRDIYSTRVVGDQQKMRDRRDWAAYLNQPIEVRARMQELADIAVLSIPEIRRMYARPNRPPIPAVQWVLGQMALWQDVEPYLTPDNQKKIMLGVERTLRDAGLDTEGKGALPNPPDWDGMTVLRKGSDSYEVVKEYAANTNLPMPTTALLGSGDFGHVFATKDPGVVLKLTEDQSEVDAAKKLLELGDDAPEGIAKYFGVVNTGSVWEKPIFALWRESAKDIGRALGAHSIDDVELLRYFRQISRVAQRAADEFGDQPDFAKQIRSAAIKLHNRVSPTTPGRDSDRTRIRYGSYASNRWSMIELAFWVPTTDATKNAGYRFAASWIVSMQTARALYGTKTLDAVGRALVTMAEVHGILLSDTRPANIGQVKRDGKKLWVIIDPGANTAMPTTGEAK